MEANIKVKSVDEMHFACINFIGKQNSENAFSELISWSESKGLTRHNDFKLVTIFYDSLKITAPELARINAGILIKAPFENEERISMVTFPKGTYIIGNFEIGLEEFKNAWTSMYMYMNKNGYKTSPLPPFQIYHNDFRQHPEKKCIVDLYIPV